MNQMKPMLFTTWKNYSKTQFIQDIVAGIIVAIIALPLSIALALASGVGPEQGIYTAIIAGIIISFLGGSHVQISGPTAAFATIVAGIVAEHGMDGLMTATILAGIILIIMGFCHFGTLIKFIPFTITTGFTSGIAVTIVIGQLKDFFGVTYPEGMPSIETAEKLEAFLAGFDTFHMDALVVGLVCLAVLIIMPKITEKIPGSFVAVLVGIAMVKLLPLEVNTIGDLYTINSSLPSLHIPSISFDMIGQMLPDAFTIAILAAIESLLSCVVADGMINQKHRSNMELAAQGMGNIASALFGGIPATGAIARTAANVKNGGRTPVAGIVHGIVLLLILVILMPYAGLIPMPTIAAVLFMVAYNMCQWRTFVRLIKTAPKSDIAVLLITFILTVAFDLVVAIEIGMLLACLLFMKRMSDESEVRGWRYVEQLTDEEYTAETEQLRKLDKRIRVYEFTGPLFFGAADLIDQITVKEMTKCLILRMRGVPSLDSTAMNALISLYEKCQKKEITLIFSHVNTQPMHAMQKAGFADRIGMEHFCSNINEAIVHAEKIINTH
ncbi:MAG: STAS domain-containing protein [Lachnospiraceae bacterium]|nr:STAS domain-containing protein [Lachnospiraceae bacterium]